MEDNHPVKYLNFLQFKESRAKILMKSDVWEMKLLQ